MRPARAGELIGDRYLEAYRDRGADRHEVVVPRSTVRYPVAMGTDRNRSMRRRLPLTASLAAALTATLASTLAVLLPVAPAAAAGRQDRAGEAITFALLGDTPYGDAQRAAFPALVDAINADRGVRFVLHAGDVKNGSSTCDDARFADLRRLYDTFDDPFVLTPGDNEWTDCHRTAAGGYLPTERLEAVRRIFFPRRGAPSAGTRCSY